MTGQYPSLNSPYQSGYALVSNTPHAQTLDEGEALENRMCQKRMRRVLRVITPPIFSSRKRMVVT